MNVSDVSRFFAHWVRRMGSLAPAAVLAMTCAATGAASATATLADQPVLASADVPGNLALALSVEYPTAISVANIGSYQDSSTYLGYFDPQKCYAYQYNSATPSSSYFQPAAMAGGTYLHSCSGYWSGNFMNWAAMPTIDPFRWALTGGYRSVDTPTQTILEKAWGSAQGSPSANFYYRGSDFWSPNNLPSSLIGSVTPFNGWVAFDTGVWGNGNMMVFSGTVLGSTQSAFSSAPVVADLTNDLSSVNSLAGSAGTYRVYVRVDVCDATTTLGTGGLESNCVKYANGYKPEGLMQQYSSKIRFSAFSYLYQNGYDRQGGVLREPMGFIGPTYPVPLSTSVVTNTRAEWDANTGTMLTNPDTTTASGSGVSNSGVMNFLNKFGESAQNYMFYDNVSELYYAVIRYFENLGNVPEWTNSVTTTELDGFPAVVSWSDPILYSCQQNFILGIGDDHTWFDYNVGGATDTSGSRPKPSAVSSDSVNQATTFTTRLQVMEGITQTPWWAAGAGQTTYYIAGLAYQAHVTDIRPDLGLDPTTGAKTSAISTVSTFWMDVEEGGGPENLNPYYLATKYGGFSVPNGYNPANTTPLATNLWDTTGNSIIMNYGISHLQPDNYFLAGNANSMVAGLKSAFTNIATAIQSHTTSFSLSTPNASSSGTASFAAQYNSQGWTGTVTGTQLTFDSNGIPSESTLWKTDVTLQAQLASGGWNTARNVVTWNGSAGVAFRTGSITSSQLSALVPGYSSPTTSSQYLNYVRGDQTNEAGSTATGSTKSLRTRSLLLGDIVDSKVTPVGVPAMNYAESTNVGYASFKTTYASRPTIVYTGANDGMMHAFLGSNGAEQFAYIPSGVFQGPTATPQVNGLVQLGNPNYSHHYLVDATPLTFDLDLNNAGGAFATTSTGTSNTSNWTTMLIGGLGKGGQSFYAINVTNPAGMTNESTVAANVMWEFTDSTMGYSFGAPIVVKTAKYGWVAILTSGYNNSDGYGYLYIVNPSNGQLLEKIKTPSASSGLTQASAYVQDYSDYTADSVYVGDLNGQLWRFDLTEARGQTSPYPQPVLLANLTDSSSNAQPVTTAPLIEIDPLTRRRFVMLGTGKLLAASDVNSTAVQSFYAILDGLSASGSFVTPFTTTITRTNLVPLTNATTGVALSATSKGWVLDLGTGTGGIAYRVLVNPVAYNGIVSFATLLTNPNACSPGGSSQVYALNYGVGTSVLNTTSGQGIITYVPAAVPYMYDTNAIIDLKVANVTSSSSGSTTSSTEILAGDAQGNVVKVPTNLGANIATRLLNWREIPTAN